MYDIIIDIITATRHPPRLVSLWPSLWDSKASLRVHQPRPVALRVQRRPKSYTRASVRKTLAGVRTRSLAQMPYKA
jgi:hypothetical protein